MNSFETTILNFKRFGEQVENHKKSTGKFLALLKLFIIYPATLTLHTPQCSSAPPAGADSLKTESTFTTPGSRVCWQGENGSLLQAGGHEERGVNESVLKSAFALASLLQKTQRGTGAKQYFQAEGHSYGTHGVSVLQRTHGNRL